MIIFEKIRWKNFLSSGNSFIETNLNESFVYHLIVIKLDEASNLIYSRFI